MSTIWFSAEILERREANDIKYVMHAHSVTINESTIVHHVDITARPALSDITRFSLVRVDPSACKSDAPVWVGTMTLLRSQVLKLERERAREGTRVRIYFDTVDVIPDDSGQIDLIVGDSVAITIEPPADC